MDWNRRVVEASAGGLWVTDLEGRTIDANAAAAALLGVSQERLADSCHADFLDADGRVQFAAHLADLRAGRVNTVEVDCLFHRPDGTSVWAVLREALLHDDDGTVTGVLMNVDSISARKQLLTDLQHSERQRVAAERVARIGSWQWDPVSGAISYSEGVVALYGDRTAAIFADHHSFLEAIHPDDRARALAAVSRLVDGGPAFEYEARMLAEQGWIWVFSRGVRSFDDSGAPGPVVGTLLDVTQVRTADEALRDLMKQNALMSAVASRANEALTLGEVLLDTRAALLHHDAWEQVRAFVPTADGDDLREVTSGPDPTAARAGESGRALVEQEQRTAMRCLARRTAVWDDAVELTYAFPVWLRDQVAAVVTITSRPPAARRELVESVAAEVSQQLARVADREQVAQELADARDRALEASRQKSTFLSTMSHEIRTPLNGVLGLTELLGRTGLDERQRHLISGIDLSGRALLAVINEVLDFSKIEAGHLELEEVEFEVRTVLDQVAGMLAEAARARGLELSVSCSPEVPQLAMGDPSRLAQVLTNLGSNAVKFTPSGRVDVRATRRDDGTGGQLLHVEVRDTGVGITADTVDSIFEPFSQADASTTRRFGGTGLGLAISREVVEAMGGRLGVDSEPGAGSTFWFSVPVRRPRDVAVDQSLLDTRDLLGDVRLLVVDDAASGPRVLAEQLAWWGVEAETVTGADAAAEVRAGGGRLDAILLDVTTPQAESFALADRIEARGRAAGYPRLPMVLLTSALPPDDALLSAHGIDRCLTRPVTSAQLRDLLLGVARPSVAASAPRQPAARSERLLVVEDNHVNRIVASGFVAALGFAVETAEDGLRALEMLARTDYDLVLMDVQMPGIDGYQTTRLLREREAVRGGRRTPVVAMTASALDDERQRALDAGLDDYLTKPVTGAQLAAMVARWVPGESTTPTFGPTAGRTATDHDHDPARLDPRGLDPARLDPRCLDPARLAELHGLMSGDYLRRAVESFLERAPQLVIDVHAAAADPDALSQAAHALRGSAANLGAVRVEGLAERLETRGADGQSADPAELAVLDAAIIETLVALRTYHAQVLAPGGSS